MPRVLPASLAPVCAAFVLTLLASVSSASALDCDQRLVVVGDHAVHVRAQCGEPAAISAHTESRTQFTGASRGGEFGGSSITVTVAIEVWLYDFGPRRFMEELTFENGILRSMRRLGYGTRAGSERRTAVEPAHRDRFAMPTRRAIPAGAIPARDAMLAPRRRAA